MGTVAAIGFSSTAGSSNFGGLGSTHEHAVFLVMIDGTPIDFSQAKYQVKSPYIHVENGVGTTLHKHATQVPVGEFFRSVGMQVTSDCFVSDDGSSYCTGDGKRLRFLVPGAEGNPAAINGYIFDDNSRFLLYYGEDSAEAVADALGLLNNLELRV